MSGIFGAGYASVYDTFYEEKDYEAECSIVQHLFSAYRKFPIVDVLDLGCGTGGHALPLAQKGLRITGIDNAPTMLESARYKAAQADLGANGVAPDFVEGDVSNFHLRRSFDAAIMMFAVLGYQHDNETLSATLASTRSHLRKEGLFIFDVWYGPAVLKQRPGDRVRTINRGDERIIRLSQATLDIRSQKCDVRFNVIRISKGILVQEIQETHTMRFFFERELELVLEKNGFRLLSLRAFPDINRHPDEETWNVIGVAQAI